MTQDKIIWKPQPGSQEAFLQSSSIYEVLYHGTRGGGKTDALIMSFAMFVGRGFGPAWKGVLFRQEYKQLEDVISKSKKWFYQIFPTAKYNNSENVWNFPDGERLLLRNFDKPDDYWKFHGHEYPWIGWEELTNWASDEGYKSMMSCSRSTLKGMPRMVRATTNPYGVGHNWIKSRFLPDTQNMKVRANLIENGRPAPPRLSIFSNLNENKIMLENDPDYVHRIAAAARNDAERKAWLEGSWDVVSGGMFDDVWETRYNVIKPFVIPKSWIIDRSFDWGSSHPFSVGWWATSDGSDVQLPNGSWKSTVRGDMFRISEWYGCTGKPNEGLRMMATDISKGIVERELSMGFRDQQNPNWCRVQTGVADSQIFAAENGNCIATDMSCRVRLDSGIVYPGISWYSADKRPGSRKTGWAQMRQMINNAKLSELGYRENPGLFVFDTCTDFIRTIPVLPRDKKDMDDIDTAAEDHIADETRYAVRFKGIVGKTMTVIGAY
jgi:hypothetical protein